MKLIQKFIWAVPFLVFPLLWGCSQPQPVPRQNAEPKPFISTNHTNTEKEPSYKSPMKKYIICIDPGHQRKANNEKEPIAPHSQIMKAKVSSGTKGIVTKKPEYILNLEVAIKVKNRLEHEGYQVVMTRSTNDVDLSNKERTAIANQAHADLLLRIHADWDINNKRQGISVLYPSENDPYTKSIYKKSEKAAQMVLNEVIQKTQAKSNGIVPREDLTGFNWSQVPAVLIEMGFMSNPEEDKKLSSSKYQEKMAEGIVTGVRTYLNQKTG